MKMIMITSLFFFLSVFNDGSSKELMNLTGTIPVPYRGECLT